MKSMIFLSVASILGLISTKTEVMISVAIHSFWLVNNPHRRDAYDF